MVQLQLVCLDPLCQIVRRHARVAQRGGRIHKQAVAGGGTKRVNDMDLAVGITLMQYHRGIACGIDRARDAG